MKNKNEISEYDKKYYLMNKEKRKKQSKIWYYQNKEKCAKNNRERYLKNKVKIDHKKFAYEILDYCKEHNKKYITPDTKKHFHLDPGILMVSMGYLHENKFIKRRSPDRWEILKYD